MEKFLKEILIRDSTLITRRDDLIKILDEEVPNNLRRNYAAIKKALSLNIGEIFAVGNSSVEEKIQKARKLLKDSGMQETRIEGVINTFVTALDLQKPPAEESKEIRKFIPESNQAVVTKKKSESNTEENSLPQPSENVVSTETAIKTESETENKTDSFVQEYLSKKIQIQTQTQTQIQTTNDEPEEEIEIPVRNVNNMEKFLKENYQSNNYNQNFETYSDGNLNKIFTYEGRLNRWRYFTKSLKLMVLMIIGAIIPFIGPIIMLAAAIGALLISVRRLHDLNKSGWFLLILLIPYVDFIFSIYLVFAPGTNGANEYGRDPLIY